MKRIVEWIGLLLLSGGMAFAQQITPHEASLDFRGRSGGRQDLNVSERDTDLFSRNNLAKRGDIVQDRLHAQNPSGVGARSNQVFSGISSNRAARAQSERGRASMGHRE